MILMRLEWSFMLELSFSQKVCFCALARTQLQHTTAFAYAKKTHKKSRRTVKAQRDTMPNFTLKHFCLD